MPTFDTPEPITVTLGLVVGDARITASQRADTVIDVRPSDASVDLDVRMAEQTRVEFVDGRLVVSAPKQRGLRNLFGKPGSIDVTIALPVGSRIQADADLATFHCVGRLGDCRIRTASGAIHVDEAQSVDVHTGFGAVVVDRVAGHAEVSTGSGRVRTGDLGATAVIKNSNGDNWVGSVNGDLRVRTANGDITVDQARASVAAVTANGDIRIGEVTRGAVTVKTACGELEVGIATGTAAWLDLHTSYGRVRNRLEAADNPADEDETVEIRAHTSYGDILIHRS